MRKIIKNTLEEYLEEYIVKKEVISEKQSIAIIALFIIGGSSIFAQGLEAKKDAFWHGFLRAPCAAKTHAKTPRQ